MTTLDPVNRALEKLEAKQKKQRDQVVNGMTFLDALERATGIVDRHGLGADPVYLADYVEQRLLTKDERTVLADFLRRLRVIRARGAEEGEKQSRRSEGAELEYNLARKALVLKKRYCAENPTKNGKLRKNIFQSTTRRLLEGEIERGNWPERWKQDTGARAKVIENVLALLQKPSRLGSR